jgi:CRISPR system Cascade subunit CasE
MMLSRLVLQPIHPDVVACLRDVQKLHEFVLLGFGTATPTRARADHGVLFRLDVDSQSGALILYVQSSSVPNWERLPQGSMAEVEGPNPAIRSIDPALPKLIQNLEVRFRLRANVTKRAKVEKGALKPGGRIPLRGDEERLAWLTRKGGDHGFEVVHRRDAPELTIRGDGTVKGQRRGRWLTFEAVRFDGVLRITDDARFREAVMSGVGPAKGYGFGLLSLAPV